MKPPFQAIKTHVKKKYKTFYHTLLIKGFSLRRYNKYEGHPIKNETVAIAQ